MTISRKRILFFISTCRQSDPHRYDSLYDAAREFGWTIKIVECRFGKVRARDLIEFWKPEGIIVDCGSGGEDLNEKTLGHLPTVYFNTKQDLHGRGGYVYSDESDIGNLAARHLLETGYENYSFVSFQLPFYWNIDRMVAFGEAVRKAGRRFCKPFETRRVIDPAERQKRLSAWLLRLPRPCALLAANDSVGEEVLDICLTHGLRVPEDIAVLGVDDEPYICEHTMPSLSSIRRDNGELFAAVARQMHRMFASRGRPCDAIMLKPDGLCVRQSSRVLTNGAHGHGVKMNMILTGKNDLYENPLDPEAFARYCAWIADYFRDRTDRFEIWNEPHNFLRKFCHKEGQPEILWIRQFIELTQKADDAIRKVRPDAVVAVSVEDWDRYLDLMLTNGIARAHNAVSFHPYCHRQHRPEREMFLCDFGARQRGYAKANGGADRWIVTEAGWSTFTGKGEYWEVAGFYPRASLPGQAACIVRMYLASLEAGCEYACQYDFKDDGLRREYTEHNFGLVRVDGTPKPSFAAVAYLTRLLGPATFRKDLSKDPTKYRVAGFVRDGKPILAAWCIEGDCEWEVPEAFGPLVDCRDLCGNPQPVPVVGGRTIRLTERPVYLLGK